MEIYTDEAMMNNEMIVQSWTKDNELNKPVQYNMWVGVQSFILIGQIHREIFSKYY